ncbi:unnamed protein product [Urochloa humidicola]
MSSERNIYVQPHLLILLTVLQPSGIIWKITAKIATVMVVIPSTYSDSNQRCCAKGHEIKNVIKKYLSSLIKQAVSCKYVGHVTELARYIQDLYEDPDVVREAFEEQAFMA